VDYSSTKNETRSNAEQSETGDDFRVNYESQSYVYFLGAENGLVKIGFASNYNERMGKLSAGSPVPLIPLAAVRGGRGEENAYHARFKKWKHHREWYYLTDELEEEIDRINYELTPRHTPIRFRGCALPLTLTRKA
jgi:hypothetical protein